jgi:hypothetical protein
VLFSAATRTDSPSSGGDEGISRGGPPDVIPRFGFSCVD